MPERKITFAPAQATITVGPKKEETVLFDCPTCGYEMHLTSTMVETNELVECGCGQQMRAGIARKKV